jgi:DNA-binding response OmpR family regulator
MTEGSGHRVLVVEDDPSTQRALATILRQEGYTVLQARDGSEAIRLWRDSGADLVLMDLVMPDKDGIETIVELRASDPDIRIVAMSGGAGIDNPRIDLLGDAKMLGAMLTIDKPFTPAEVIAVVRRALKGDA